MDRADRLAGSPRRRGSTPLHLGHPGRRDAQGGRSGAGREHRTPPAGAGRRAHRAVVLGSCGRPPGVGRAAIRAIRSRPGGGAANRGGGAGAGASRGPARTGDGIRCACSVTSSGCVCRTEPCAGSAATAAWCLARTVVPPAWSASTSMSRATVKRPRRWSEATPKPRPRPNGCSSPLPRAPSSALGIGTCRPTASRWTSASRFSLASIRRSAARALAWNRSSPPCTPMTSRACGRRLLKQSGAAASTATSVGCAVWTEHIAGSRRTGGWTTHRTARRSVSRAYCSTLRRAVRWRPSATVRPPCCAPPSRPCRAWSTPRTAGPDAVRRTRASPLSSASRSRPSRPNRRRDPRRPGAGGGRHGQ